MMKPQVKIWIVWNTRVSEKNRLSQPTMFLNQTGYEANALLRLLCQIFLTFDESDYGSKDVK